MTVSICGRRELTEKIAEGFPLMTAVISFTDEGSKPVDLKGKPAMSISKRINDVRWIDDPDEWHHEDFMEIARFIHKCIRSNYDIICQCEYGSSRSPACAMAIKEYVSGNGIEIFRNYDYYPNQIFFNNILNCLYETEEEIRK